jgi:hypothetical protein
LEKFLQRLQFRDIAFEDNGRTGNTVMIPASAVSNLQALVASRETMTGVGLAIVGFLRLVDLSPDQE